MDRLRSLALLCVASLAFLPSVARAQGAQASIAGFVRDSSGAVLPGVTVEASSPALIEKVRSVVSAATGQYQIIALPPGAYTVTFTLPGFSSMRRENIQLAGSATVTVNADLAVGSVQETLTVTGEAPTVDIQNTRRNVVISEQVVAALPAGRSSYNLAVLIPGVMQSPTGTGAGTNVQDVGGTQNMTVQTYSVHGNRALDQRLQINGLTMRHILASAASNFVPDMGAASEVVIDYSSGTSEAQSAGLMMNLIPKEGGNAVKSSTFASAANSSFQGNNYSDELKAAGLATPNTLKTFYDINPTVGGPIMKDRLWFFGSIRWQESSTYQAGVFGNKNSGDLTKWNYEPNDERGLASLKVNPSAAVRVTWQATPKNKFSGSWDPQERNWDNAILNGSSENYQNFRFSRQSFKTIGWTAPMTNRLLFDARFGSHAEVYTEDPPAWQATSIPVTDLNTNFTYRGRPTRSSQDSPAINEAQASMSYVSGAHVTKVGFQDGWGGVNFCTWSTNDYGLVYSFQGGQTDAFGRSLRPASITQNAMPNCQRSDLVAELGLYAQDKWTVKRLTVNGGLRYDYYKNQFPDQLLGPTVFTPTRNVIVPGRSFANLKDITPRIGAAFDLFGTGKTSLKTSWGKYLAVYGAGTGNPLSLLTPTASRSWTPSLPVGDPNYYVPQCDLLNPAANGDCGALNNARFGQLAPSAAIDPRTYSGWGRRPWNQEFSVSVQHELMPRVSVDVGYFRRWYGNFTVVDNRAVGPEDYIRYSFTAPTDPRLALSSQVIDGLLEVVPAKAGLVDNYTTFADDYGKQIEHWNGMDFSVNTRLRSGLVVQGGVSTGRTSTDNCDLRATLPEITRVGTAAVPESQCHVDTNFLTQVKLLGTYLVPKVDVQFGVTFQSSPGPQIVGNYNVTLAQTNPRLASFQGGNVRQVNVVMPGSEYIPRANQLDLRVSKILRMARYRTSLNVDLANALNSNDVLGANSTYGTAWLSPLSIMNARLFKVSAQLDF